MLNHQLKLLDPIGIAISIRQSGNQIGQRFQIDGFSQRSASESCREQSGGGGDAKGRGGLVGTRGVGLVGDGPTVFDHLSRRQVTKSHRHRTDISLAIRFRFKLVHRHSSLSRCHFGGVYFVVAEVFLLQAVLFKAKQFVAANSSGIELDLHFHILGRRTQGAGNLAGKTIISGFGGIEQVVATVALAREGFKYLIVQALGADAGRIESDARVAHRCHHLGQALGIGIAQIDSAVSEQNDAILSIVDFLLLCLFKSQLQSGFDVGAAFTGQIVNELNQLMRLRPADLVSQ